MIEHRPLRIPSAKKTELRLQFGALCYRVNNGKLQILLVTGRKSGRWTIPKGWPVNKATPAQAALTEAYEEAGVKGRIDGDCLGIYQHFSSKTKSRVPRMVAVYPVRVKKRLDDYPEKGSRKVRWYTPRKASKRVVSPELSQMLLSFRPSSKPTKSK